MSAEEQKEEEPQPVAPQEPEPEPEPAAQEPESSVPVVVAEAPPHEEENVPTIRATFTIKPENFKHRVQISIDSIGAEVKALLSKDLRISIGAIVVFYEGKIIPDDQPLSVLGLEANSDVDFDLVLDYSSHIAKEKAAIVAGKLPETIDVEVVQGPGKPIKLVHVHIDVSKRTKKAYIGGYRDKRDGLIYHHASTNNERSRRMDDPDKRLTRETQTFITSTHTVQSSREASTQMARKNLLLDSKKDKVMVPGKYVTSDEFAKTVLEKTVMIQRNLRMYIARKKVWELRTKKEEHEKFIEEQMLLKIDKEEADRRYNIERRMRPKKKSDFNILHEELETWNTQETLKIKESDLSPEEKQKALQKLLFKETKLLQTIDRLKVLAQKENQEDNVNKMLSKMSKPKRWNLKDGHVIEVHTPYTTRAIELQQLYFGLQVPILTTEERLDVLLHVKWTVKEFDCNLTREIVDLIDREADLLSRGRNPKTLTGLRRRISHLFITFTETPEFNPEVAKYQINVDDAYDLKESVSTNFDSVLNL